MILYDLVIGLFALFSLPRVLYQKKYRTTFLHKIGIKQPTFPFANHEPVIWIHAVSLGETKGSLSLAKKLQEKYPNYKIILSTATETGLQEGKKHPFFDHVFLLPVDISFVMKRLVKNISPHLLILIEGDYWYNQLRYSKKIGAKIIVMSGKISTRSAKRLSWVPFFTKRLFSQIDHLLVQDEIQKENFSKIASSTKLSVSGNIKLTPYTITPPSEQLSFWKESFHIQKKEKIITIASTHFPEEKELLQRIKPLFQDSPVKIFLAPRHPERFKEVEAFLQNSSYSYITLSNISAMQGNESIILIDKMGFLPICYSLSHLTIVGGTFVKKVGGHNLIEPNFFSSPVAYGPYTWAQSSLRKMVEEHQTGEEVSLDSLQEKIKEMIQESPIYAKNCFTLKASLNDTIENNINLLSGYLSS